ncbi:uncharacterized protein LOC106131061 [Amyelois transitella]|uniref:uncharacterized protein LOC106131061 n=1 Tax=Amyelois transitella TaxID=680683 RepID=UPI00298FD5D6|nr:uncharacterized protein LOC106131061 [Amyelois transitella]
MEIIPPEEHKSSKGFYLPHFAVVRNDRSTTKVRIVFDASCPGSNGVSLNQDLLVGPTLQDDLRHILMRWRAHPVCISSDIVKMYRQVRVSSEDVDFQRILWREDSASEVQHYRLLTVTFGTSSAPYLAIRSLRQVAYDEGVHFPIAAKKVLSDFYVDDLMSGCENFIEGQQLYTEMKQLLRKGGFELQKWTSNDKNLMKWIENEEKLGDKSMKEQIKDNRNSEDNDNRIAEQESKTETPKFVDKSDSITKILGLTWDKCNDTFKYLVQLPTIEEPITKRKVISDISRLYDPLGWLAPIVIKAKIFIQKLWTSGLKWDEKLTPQLLTEWVAYRNELLLIKSFEIPRWMNTRKDDTSVQLHGFCDASSEAYAAVVYIRVIDKCSNINVNLVTSKTKVAPIKQLSIPRLELCGATILSKLLIEVADILGIPKQHIHAWSDSSVVLAWLSIHPSRWKVFVANRVAEILGSLDRSQWSHVQSKYNPADIASRGIMPSDISKMRLWKQGPDFLRKVVINYNGDDITYDTNTEEKGNKICQVLTSIDDDVIIWERFSSLRRLLRVISWCRRFILKSINKTNEGPQWLTNVELQQTLHIYIKQCQVRSFYEDIESITKGGTVKTKSKLKPLNPYLDDDGLLRVGGRLDRTATFLNVNKRHPIILPAKAHLTNLIIKDTHERTIHGGIQIMINHLRTKYWVIDAKNQVKHYIRNCVICIRYASQRREQLMGQLPTARVTPMRPFKRSGVDYAGPIAIRTSKGRGHHAYKGYICLFICMVTRAIHLEVVSDLTAQGFIAAFKRFVARRGHCAELFSDNGTNFVGAERELKSLLFTEKSRLLPEIANWLSTNGTEWHFIPPHSPNFGGLWEAGVKSTKYHLRRIIGTSTLTFEEMSTLLSQIEACLNSRPLSSLSSSADDPEPLTPGHFLIGEPLVLVPDANYETSNMTSLKRWQFMQRMVQDFWRRWSQEYLTQFLHRYKWSYQTPEPNIGDIVLVKEDDLPPARWLYGVITQKHPGLDNITRVVTLKCKGNIIKRPVSKLCILPIAK